MSTRFFDVSEPEMRGETLGWDVPEGWGNGRTTFGGLQQAALIRAMEREAEGQRIRTLSAMLCGPLAPGVAEVRIEVVRRGSKTTAMTAALVQGGEVKTHAFGFFGARRVDDADWCDVSAPEAPSWHELEEAVMPTPPAPEFTARMHFWPVYGFPYSGSSARSVVCWSRPRDAGVWDAARVAATADAIWPVPLTVQTDFRPLATVTSRLQFLHHLADLPSDEPLLVRCESPVSVDGYTSERREIWTADGRLAAINEQSFAFIR